MGKHPSVLQCSTSQDWACRGRCSEREAAERSRLCAKQGASGVATEIGQLLSLGHRPQPKRADQCKHYPKFALLTHICLRFSRLLRQNQFQRRSCLEACQRLPLGRMPQSQCANQRRYYLKCVLRNLPHVMTFCLYCSASQLREYSPQNPANNYLWAIGPTSMCTAAQTPLAMPLWHIFPCCCLSWLSALPCSSSKVHLWALCVARHLWSS